jgi:hypothetical protein
MTTYSIILFLHVASALGLFASLSFELLSLFHLRRASDLPGVRRWIDPVPGLPVLAMSSILVVFFSGISPAVRMSAFETAWPKVTIAALLLIAPLEAVTAKHMRAWDCVAHDRQAGIVAIDRHRRVSCSSWSIIGGSDAERNIQNRML